LAGRVHPESDVGASVVPDHATAFRFPFGSRQGTRIAVADYSVPAIRNFGRSEPIFATSEIVMMDNLPAQEVAGVCEAIEATGAMLRHFPPQSIEQSFAKLKAHLRKAAERSIPALWDRIGNNPRHRYPRRANYFRHAGHGSN
jgi:hypothetical protein